MKTGANPLVKKAMACSVADTPIHVTYVLSFTALKFELSLCVVKTRKSYDLCNENIR
jgi:hypothetical protein